MDITTEVALILGFKDNVKNLKNSTKVENFVSSILQIGGKRINKLNKEKESLSSNQDLHLAIRFVEVDLVGPALHKDSFGVELSSCRGNSGSRHN
jgi:hypothetical protein